MRGASLLAFAGALAVGGTLAVDGVAPAEARAQTFQGRVVEEGSDAPVATALVSLLDAEGEQVGASIADASGVYRVEAPEPGIYRLRAERIGYATFETPLLDAGTADGTYPIELVMGPDPYELPGFTVMTNRVTDEQADREVRLMIGLSVPSLRFDPIDYDEIQAHVEKARDLAYVMRWTNNAGLVVTRDTEGPCFSIRARGCLPVYLNGLRLRREFVETVPLDMVYRIVVLTPTDGSMAYPGGGVLLFTEAWLR